jgi:hypothetical protein
MPSAMTSHPCAPGPLAEIYADRVDGADGLACVGQAIVTEVDPARSGHAKGLRPI